MSLIDIFPTVLSSVGIKNLRNCEGINLSDKLSKKRGLFAHLSKNSYCFVYDDWKLIKYPSIPDDTAQYIKVFFPEYSSQNYQQFFNIVKDPKELVDLKSAYTAEFKDLLFKLSQKTQRMKSEAKPSEFFNINEEEKEKLRSLGYAQ